MERGRRNLEQCVQIEAADHNWGTRAALDRFSRGRFGLPKLGGHQPTVGQCEPAVFFVFGLSVFGSLLTFGSVNLENVKRIHSGILPPTS